ncbi:cupin domain-containing protein [Streptomyces sp. NPDC046985]|uniref:cupin domain-containing protein n=1 Tax=Streptomyces sp. NPDC046985 TaxID=3155377 RepID=UPI0034033BC1
MAVRTGDVYVNPPCCQRIVVRTAAQETGGVRSVMDLYVAPGGFAADFHVHPASEERFTLVRGRLRVSIAGTDVILDEPGQTVAVPPGTVHRFFSASDHEETFAVVEFTQRADRFERLLLRQLFGLAEDGRLDDQGIPGPLQTAVTMLEFSDVLRFTSRPWPVQRTLYALLAPVARMRGYRACDPVAEERPASTAEPETLPQEVAAAVNSRQVPRPAPQPHRR